MENRQVWPAEAEPQGPVGPAFRMPTADQTPAIQAPDVTIYSAQRPVLVPAAPAPAGPFFAGLPLWMLVVAVAVGAAAALVTIPTWVPVLGASVSGAEPKVWWYLTRASALVAFVLLWISMVSGLLITNKMARVWPGVFTAFDLHQFTSLLGLGFTLLHVVLLLGNSFFPYSVAQLLIPIVDAPYRPFWVALGQIGLYVTIPVTFTFYIRKQIGNRTWHLIHFLSYGVFALALLHGLFSGTDSNNTWVLGMYWLSGASLLALTIHRMTAKKAVLVRQC